MTVNQFKADRGYCLCISEECDVFWPFVCMCGCASVCVWVYVFKVCVYVKVPGY